MNLPTKLKLDLCEVDDQLKDEICEAVSDYLSRTYGYCINGYCYEATIEVDEIDWDTEES